MNWHPPRTPASAKASHITPRTPAAFTEFVLGEESPTLGHHSTGQPTSPGPHFSTTKLGDLQGRKKWKLLKLLESQTPRTRVGAFGWQGKSPAHSCPRQGDMQSVPWVGTGCGQPSARSRVWRLEQFGPVTLMHSVLLRGHRPPSVNKIRDDFLHPMGFLDATISIREDFKTQE